MTWFETLTTCPEESHASVHQSLRIDGPRLISSRNQQSWLYGELETPSLAELRDLRNEPDLERCVLRLRVEMRVSPPEYEEAATVLGLTRSLARDWGPDNIRVNSIAPGWIMTERQKTLWLTLEGERELMTRQCLKRQLVPDDIARVVLFMASDASSAMTNQSYIVDGGWV